MLKLVILDTRFDCNLMTCCEPSVDLLTFAPNQIQSSPGGTVIAGSLLTIIFPKCALRKGVWEEEESKETEILTGLSVLHSDNLEVGERVLAWISMELAFISATMGLLWTMARLVERHAIRRTECVSG